MAGLQCQGSFLPSRGPCKCTCEMCALMQVGLGLPKRHLSPSIPRGRVYLVSGSSFLGRDRNRQARTGAWKERNRLRDNTPQGLGLGRPPVKAPSKLPHLLPWQRAKIGMDSLAFLRESAILAKLAPASGPRSWAVGVLLTRQPHFVALLLHVGTPNGNSSSAILVLPNCRRSRLSGNAGEQIPRSCESLRDPSRNPRR